MYNVWSLCRVDLKAHGEDLLPKYFIFIIVFRQVAVYKYGVWHASTKENCSSFCGVNYTQAFCIIWMGQPENWLKQVHNLTLSMHNFWIWISEFGPFGTFVSVCRKGSVSVMKTYLSSWLTSRGSQIISDGRQYQVKSIFECFQMPFALHHNCILYRIRLVFMLWEFFQFVLVFDLAGTLKLEVSPVLDTPTPCLSPELIPVKPVSEKKHHPVKELLEFPSNDVYVPHCTYRSICTFNCEPFRVLLHLWYYR